MIPYLPTRQGCPVFHLDPLPFLFLIFSQEAIRMCSIFGLTSARVPRELIETCFNRTISRGPDMSRLEEIPGGILGFHRLAIMGLNAALPSGQ